MESNKDERKNKQIAAATTVAVNVLVLLMLLFVAAWKAPDPPNPEFGIELNFGMDTQGGGDVQPLEPSGSEQVEEEADEQQSPKQEEAAPQETKQVEEEVSSKVESPVVVKETKEKPTEPVKEVKKEVKKADPVKTDEKPKEDTKAIYKPVTEGDKTKATDKQGKEVSQGDDPGKVGDKGDPKGSLDAKALYGKQGGGDGGVSMSGFTGFDWPKITTPALPDEAFGIYEFLVKIDNNGDVISVKPLQRGLSLEAEKRFIKIIEGLSFVSKGGNIPDETEGKIVFKVVSK